MSLFFNILSRFVIACLPKSKCLLISQLHLASAVILEFKKLKSSLFALFPHLFAMKWWNRMPSSLLLGCCFKLVFFLFFSLSTFTFIKRLLSPSSFSAIRVVSCAYLKLLIFLPEDLISAWASSSPAFHMMDSAYNLNKQSDNIQPWHTPFTIWNQSIVTCPVLTCFLTWIQVFQEAWKVIWYFHLFKKFPSFFFLFLSFFVIHTVHCQRL